MALKITLYVLMVSQTHFLGFSENEISLVIVAVFELLFDYKMCLHFVTLSSNKKFSHGSFLIFCSASRKLSNGVFGL